MMMIKANACEENSPTVLFTNNTSFASLTRYNIRGEQNMFKQFRFIDLNTVYEKQNPQICRVILTS